MKTLKTSAIGVLLFVCCLQAQAQALKAPPVNEPDNGKPKLFGDLPQKMMLQVSALEPLFDLAPGSAVTFSLADKFQFKGTVVSKSSASNVSAKTIVIRSANREGAAFTFTRATGRDGILSYSGRIISIRHSDAFIIVHENGQYYLQKKNFYELVNE